jgi:hypothetical protein
MGRSYSSVRQELNSVAERWARTARHPGGDVQVPGARLAGWAKQHSSEAFFGCNGPAEAALFSVLIEVQRLRDRHASSGEEAGAGITGGDGDLDP